ncbi:hypothetical protein HPP92_013212 [Vanilla planifolia]|uniref:Uncharacterized protein n=1 Tax=Vanilla planifolia TaxID=51239 RepID=A0A835QSK7_VANPL|nr:hypothetical protein HPP92_013212 [Vanilla planifolia]
MAPMQSSRLLSSIGFGRNPTRSVSCRDSSAAGRRVCYSLVTLTYSTTVFRVHVAALYPLSAFGEAETAKEEVPHHGRPSCTGAELFPSFSARSRSSPSLYPSVGPRPRFNFALLRARCCLAGSSGNKRRRPIPSAPALKASASSSPQLAATEITPYIPPNQPHVVESNALPEGTDAAISHEEESKEDPILPPAGSSAEMKVGPKNPAVNWILDVLDDALKEVRSVIAVQGLFHLMIP